MCPLIQASYCPKKKKKKKKREGRGKERRERERGEREGKGEKGKKGRGGERTLSFNLYENSTVKSNLPFTVKGAERPHPPTVYIAPRKLYNYIGPHGLMGEPILKFAL
ncbi:hypothetical protein GCM10010095_84960 [Streptomyces anthocyanicus]|nr:hypothetical protein GCM10010095_84960 [Streptomyces anthocyanicus]